MDRRIAQILSLVRMGVSLGTSTYLFWGSWSVAQQEVTATRAPASLNSRSVSRTGSTQTVSLVSLDEVLVNVASEGGASISTLGVTLELELFEEGTKSLIEHKQAGIRNAIIETSYGQTTDLLRTLGGKLQFKETLVSRLNTYLGQPVIRDIHFSSFLIQ